MVSARDSPEALAPTRPARPLKPRTAKRTTAESTSIRKTPVANQVCSIISWEFRFEALDHQSSKLIARANKENLRGVSGALIAIVKGAKIGIPWFVEIILPDPAFTIVVFIYVSDVDDRFVGQKDVSVDGNTVDNGIEVGKRSGHVCWIYGLVITISFLIAVVNTQINHTREIISPHSNTKNVTFIFDTVMPFRRGIA